ncbi:M9 family metallopeptidase N-terminal domain-containing protein [Streptomyces sp. CA2R101]|uniref:M9 family metallopeptidase N-terminal domain-containing protein n=1 Tax=Streptomyces sp. CA2R101 TaxID=3120152 RepID=UPI0030090302
MVLDLRACYYIQYNQPENVGEYGPALKSAVQGALDGFFGSSHACDVTEANGETLAETVTLIDSSGENARYLDVVKASAEGLQLVVRPVPRNARGGQQHLHRAVPRSPAAGIRESREGRPECPHRTA